MSRASVSSDVWRAAQGGHLETWQGYAERGVAASPERAEVWKSILAAMAASAPLRAGERVLDIGGGLDTVLDFLPDVRGHALDPLATHLRGLGLSRAATAVSGVFETLPYADGGFDRVFLMNVLDHVREPGRGLAEIARVLAPGGVLVLSVDTFAGRKYWEKRAHKWWERVRGARTKHPWVFSNPDVERLLADAGLRTLAHTHVPGTKPRRRFFTARKPE